MLYIISAIVLVPIIICAVAAYIRAMHMTDRLEEELDTLLLLRAAMKEETKIYRGKVEKRLEEIRQGSPSRYWIMIDEVEKILDEEC